MRFVKNISLFIVYPFSMLIFGFVMGMTAYHFFYPEYGKKKQDVTYSVTDSLHVEESKGAIGDDIVTVSQKEDRLSADTEYVVLENDLDTGELNEVTGKLPHKYIGMDREQFMTAMENFEAGPPLSEREKGFTGLQVASFSRERVTVQMFYRTEQNQEIDQIITVSGGDMQEDDGSDVGIEIGADRNPERTIADGEVWNEENKEEEKEKEEEGEKEEEKEKEEEGEKEEEENKEEEKEKEDGEQESELEVEEHAEEERSYGFYLAVYNHEVVAYLADQKTLFINTGIKLDTLPEEMQKQIIKMLWLPDQETLFRFLEAYSS